MGVEEIFDSLRQSAAVVESELRDGMPDGRIEVSIDKVGHKAHLSVTLTTVNAGCDQTASFTVIQSYEERSTRYSQAEVLELIRIGLGQHFMNISEALFECSHDAELSTTP